MPEKKKKTFGQQFVEALEKIAKDKDKLLGLASLLIKSSPSHRGLKDRDLPNDETAVRMKAAIAKFNALAHKDVSTDGMLALIADTYRKENFGSPAKFKEDFKKKYPNEYSGHRENSPKTIAPISFQKTSASIQM